MTTIFMLLFKFLKTIAKTHSVVVIVPVYQKSADGKFYNAAVVIDADGSIHTPYHKVHIPQDFSEHVCVP